MSHSIKTDWHNDVIATITFSDPERKNQLCWAAVDQLGETLCDCRTRGARVLILASSLEGHWLQHAWLQDLCDGLEGKEQTGSGAGWFNTLNELSQEDVISIAAISGDSAGGGAELGWACDLRLAEAQAQISQPEIKLGLTTGIGGSSRLTRLAGPGIATEMVLTGEPVSVQRLHAAGAITRVVGTGQALPSAITLAENLVSRSPHALKGLKRVLRASENASLKESLANEQSVFQTVAATDEALQTMKAAQAKYDQ